MEQKQRMKSSNVSILCFMSCYKCAIPHTSCHDTLPCLRPTATKPVDQNWNPWKLWAQMSLSSFKVFAQIIEALLKRPTQYLSINFCPVFTGEGVLLSPQWCSYSLVISSSLELSKPRPSVAENWCIVVASSLNEFLEIVFLHILPTKAVSRVPSIAEAQLDSIQQLLAGWCAWSKELTFPQNWCFLIPRVLHPQEPLWVLC